MKKIGLIVLFLWGGQLARLSAQQPCNTFDCAYQKAEQILKTSTAKDKYEKVLANLDDAENFAGNDPVKKDKIRALQKRLFEETRSEKERADRLPVEAKNQTEKAIKEKLFQPIFIPCTITIIFMFVSPAILLLCFFIVYKKRISKPQVTYRKYHIVLIAYHVFLLSIIGICSTLVTTPTSASTLEQNTLIVIFAVNNLLFLCVTFFILYSQLSKQT